MDFSTYGWVSPLGKDSEILTYTVGSCTMFCARKQEKILPAAAINEQLEEKIAALETEQARKVYRKERQNFKDEVVHTLIAACADTIQPDLCLCRPSIKFIVYRYFQQE